ncbi:hypoxanthine phosphoribosyltransferase [bacterium]|nr:hypoxanthine phosphoribosyltransferase [bacterium]MCB2179109.1 hypoxanthine phosphoribosyltransferase [bacterium]
MNNELTAGIDRVLFTAEQIQTRVEELGSRISRDYVGKKPLLVGVLRGVVFFMVDLMRTIDIPLEVDFMAISSYSPESRDMGLVRVVKDLELSITNRHVLFVEDIVDTGMTLHHLLRTLTVRQPASLEVCVLFNKEKDRQIDVPIKYKGFDIPDDFVVGYGLDYREGYRNLPFVATFNPQALRKD